MLFYTQYQKLNLFHPMKIQRYKSSSQQNAEEFNDDFNNRVNQNKLEIYKKKDKEIKEKKETITDLEEKLKYLMKNEIISVNKYRMSPPVIWQKGDYLYCSSFFYLNNFIFFQI